MKYYLVCGIFILLIVFFFVIVLTCIKRDTRGCPFSKFLTGRLGGATVEPRGEEQRESICDNCIIIEREREQAAAVVASPNI